MANSENHDQSTLPVKRKCDLIVSEVKEESSVKLVKKSEDAMESIDERSDILESSVKFAENVVGDDGAEEDDDENDADYEAEESKKKKKEEAIDLKGKRIMRDDKGKGKMIVEEDDEDSDHDSDDDDDMDDDDDSDDDSDESDDSDEFWLDDDEEDSDLENPLGKVNLDNILPSRTRNRGGGTQKGIVIADDPRDGCRNDDGSNSNS